MSKVLGVRIDNISLLNVRRKVRDFLHSEKQYTIFTPNPEILVAAYGDNKFKEILNSGSLNICDGRGIEFVVKQKIERITGVDLLVDICTIAEEEKKSVYLLGAGESGGPDKAVEILKKKFPTLNISGYSKGPHILSVSGGTMSFENEEDNVASLEEIIKKAPDIIFVAFGHKKQEYWIHQNLQKMPSVKIAMGVGGAFDYIGGRKKRAPKWMRRVGLEWIYRLIHEPKRIGRIWNATVKFLFLNFLHSRSKT